jgi:hypothetical protein
MALIRSACLTGAADWVPPTSTEIRSLVKIISEHKGKTLSGSDIADLLRLGVNGARTYRKWAGGESDIPYAAWAVLCEIGGFGLIWRVGDKPTLLTV